MFYEVCCLSNNKDYVSQIIPLLMSLIGTGTFSHLRVLTYRFLCGAFTTASCKYVLNRLSVIVDLVVYASSRIMEMIFVKFRIG
jgi:hypothetical protein